LPRWLEFSLGSTPRIVPLASTQLSLYGTNDQLPSDLFVCLQPHAQDKVSYRYSRETGSITTACLARSSSPPSPTTQSQSNGDFPAFSEKPRIGGLASGRLVSVKG
jgi:hypothetical protein